MPNPSEPTEAMFSGQPRLAIVAVALAVVPSIAALLLPIAIATYLFLILPFVLVAALILAIASTFVAGRRQQKQGLAWLTIVLALVQLAYLVSLFI